MSSDAYDICALMQVDSYLIHSTHSTNRASTENKKPLRLKTMAPLRKLSRVLSFSKNMQVVTRHVPLLHPVMRTWLVHRESHVGQAYEKPHIFSFE